LTQVAAQIAGYDYGTVPRSPVRLDELEQLKQAVGFTEGDHDNLQMASAILVPQAEEMVSAWRKKIGEQPHLLASFVGPDGQPDEGYKAAVKARFVQWVVDICTRPFDEAWLDYQDEIAKRHTPIKKMKPTAPKRRLWSRCDT
jgi:hypothetical protein